MSGTEGVGKGLCRIQLYYYYYDDDDDDRRSKGRRRIDRSRGGKKQRVKQRTGEGGK